MPITVLGGTTSAAGAFEVANSVRMNGDARMYITPSAGDADKWTFSCWVKRSIISSGSQTLISAKDGSNYMTEIRFNSDDTIDFYSEDGASGFNGRLNTSRKFRDVSAWYHVVAVWDSENGTAGNRMRLYINGVEETAFGTDTNPSDGDDSYIGANIVHTVGDKGDDSQNFKGYMAEVYYCNGQAYAASDFGEFDEDSPTIWKPKDASGLTFGTGGFYLDFEASDNLGNDANGGTDLTENGLAATDQSVDSPTNNFCVVNPLDNYHAGATLTEGNCLVAHPSAKYNYITSTFGVSKGKWYFEGKLTVSGGTAATIGIAAEPTTSASDHLGGDAQGISIYQTDDGTFIRTSGSNTTLGDSDVVANDIIGVFIDLDNNKIYGSVNGTLETTTGISITAAASQTHGLYFPAMGDYDGGQAYTWAMNFGGCPSFALSSAVSDDNGYGNFEYTPTVTVDSASTKFYALCTKNLAEYG